jgi:hypothetical protein
MKTLKFLKLNKFMLGVMIFTIPLIGFSQKQNEKFISPVSEKEVGLNQGQSKRIENIKGNKLHKSVQYVKIGNLSKIANSCKNTRHK